MQLASANLSFDRPCCSKYILPYTRASLIHLDCRLFLGSMSMNQKKNWGIGLTHSRIIWLFFKCCLLKREFGLLLWKQKAAFCCFQGGSGCLCHALLYITICELKTADLGPLQSIKPLTSYSSSGSSYYLKLPHRKQSCEKYMPIILLLPELPQSY